MRPVDRCSKTTPTKLQIPEISNRPQGSQSTQRHPALSSPRYVNRNSCFPIDLLKIAHQPSRRVCTVVIYNTIQYNTIQYNTIQYNTIQYNTIQYNTIQYNFIVPDREIVCIRSYDIPLIESIHKMSYGEKITHYYSRGTKWHITPIYIYNSLDGSKHTHQL